MKMVILILVNFFLSVASVNANGFGEKEKKAEQKKHSTEIKNLFNRKIEGLNERGSVVALVKIDNKGFGRVLESNASTPELEEIVKQQVENKQFKSFKNELIKLKVEFKK